LRKVAAAALAVPVLAIVYLPVLARRPVAARLALIGSIGIVVLVAALGLSQPTPIRAVPPSPPISAVADDAFQSIGAATELHAAVDIRFSEAMDPRSVEASLTVSPETPVRTAWNATHTVLSVSPVWHWAPGTYHTLSVAPGALSAAGRPMSVTARAVFVTRAMTGVRIEAADRIGTAASIATGFRITFDRPVATASVAAALRITPAVDGELVADSGRPDVAADASRAFTFVPTAALRPATTYHVAIGSLVDLDGAAVAPTSDVAVKTVSAPRIIRFRPADKTRDIDQRGALSVRFSEAMDHASTQAAFHVLVNGKAIAGSVRFAEGSTVLVFQPAKPLIAGAHIVVSVAATATSTRGVPLATAAAVTLTTKATAKATSTRISTSSGSGSGSAVGGGSWGAVETYYLRLMNCTRTGGWVTSTGSCSSPGGRNVAPLKLDAGISSKVSRPYAKKLAVNGWCDHFIGGTPGDRLRAAGYTSYIWAENLGCRSGNPYSAVLGSHLYFQSEKPYNGGHYVNLMNSAYDRCGIGVWVSGGRVRLVVDFYHPR
jgi:uncharacterized protein YkwD